MTEYLTTELGDRVAYDLRGAGPGLIFVAGAGPSRETDPTTTATAVAAAELGVTTVVYDRLDRGASRSAGGAGPHNEVAVLAALTELVGGSAVLCGHSSGGAIALFAATQGIPVSGLALWELPFGNIAGGTVPWAHEVVRRIDAGDLEGALAHYMKDMPPEWLEGAKQSPMYPQIVAQVVSYRADADALAWTESAPLAELVAGIGVPALVLVGERTFPLLERGADALAAALPLATRKAMPGAEHSWDPAPMAAELARFARLAR